LRTTKPAFKRLLRSGTLQMKSNMDKVLKGKWTKSNKMIELNVAVILFEEEGLHFSYIPSLDITGYGENEEKAKESLNVNLSEFFSYTLNKNTFWIELKRLGWKIKKEKKSMVAPGITDLAPFNDQLKDIINNKVYSTSQLPIQLPAFS